MHTRCCIRLFVFSTLLLSLATNSAFAQGQKITRENRDATADERDNPQERARWFLRGRTVNGRPAPQLLHKAYQEKLNHRRLQQAKQSEARTLSTQSAQTSSTSSSATSTASPSPSFVPSSTPGAVWIPLGPAPSGTASVGDLTQDYGPAVGRTTVVVVDQSDTTGNTVYIGGASGGLWKSTNAADSNVQNCNTLSVSSAPHCAPNVTWTPLIDQQATLTVGAMGIKPDNSSWLLVGTGEANNSVDSYYGLGFLLSQDGGATWTLISSAKSANGASTIDLHGLGTTQIAFAGPDRPNLVVATMAAASGGITVGSEFAGDSARGIYFSTDGGQNWQHATVSDPRGTLQNASANTVIYNPNNKTFYADLRWHGVYSSTDGQNWKLLDSSLGTGSQPGGSTLNIYSNCPATVATTNVCPLYRSVLTQVAGRTGPNGKGEMYIFIVDANDVDKGIYQSLDGGTTWTALSMTGLNSCDNTGETNGCGTDQGSYNLSLLAVPNGTSSTDLWAGAVNQYRCTIAPATSPATCSFANLTHTYGSCSGYFDTSTGGFSHVHPDQHGIDFVQSRPDIVYFGNDGGIYRVLKSQTGLPSTAVCSGTASQPWVQFDNLSGTMGSMLQYVWFSQHPTDNTTLLGGTQDNGSMAKNGSSPSTNFGYSWQSVNNGDGGYNDINTTNPKEWFTNSPTFPGHVDIEQCTNSSGITCTANTFSQIVSQTTLGSDNAPFYMPFMLDPQAANHLLAGTCRLWRVDRSTTNPASWPTSTALTYNLDSFSSQSAVACSTTAFNQVSAIAAGGPCKGVCNSGTNGTGNGSQVLYVGTAFGKLFVTTNADGGPSTWVDRSSASGFVNTANTSCANGAASCGYPISNIAIDPSDPTGKTAFVTVMGFKTGHVFKTTDGGASFTNLDGFASGAGLPDNPADAVVVDPNQKGLVYVATDVGVFSSHTDSSDPQFALGTWAEVGPSSGSGSLPNVAATTLHIFGTGANTRLRVSTHGRGIWDISVAPVPTFTIALSKPSATPMGQPATITGTISLINGYSYPITLSCTNLDPSLTCNFPTQPLPAGTISFSFTVTGTTAGTYNVTVAAVGGDPQALTEQATTSLTVLPPPDFSFAPAVSPAIITAAAGGSATSNFALNANSTFNGTVTLTCTLPASFGTCSLSPASVSLAANGAANIVATVTPAAATAPGTYTNALTVTAASGTISHQATASVQVLEPPDFTVSAPSVPAVAAGLTASGTFNLTANTTFNSQYSNNGTITLACDVSSLPAGTTCTFTPSSTVTVNAAQTQTITVSVLTTATTAAASYPVTITATPATGTVHTQQFSVTVQAATDAFELSGQVQFPTPSVKVGGTLTNASLLLRSSAYSGTVNLSCSQSPACTVNPASIALTSGQSATINVSFSASGLKPGTGSFTVSATDGTLTEVSPQGFNYNVTDYSVTAGATSAILPGGSTTSAISFAALSGYTGTINATCSVQGTPLTCTLSPVGPYTVPGAPSVTATISGPGATNTTASGTYDVTLQTSDAGFATLFHNVTVPVTIQDYKLATADSTGAAKTTATVTAGQSATFALSAVAQAGGFTGNITLDVATLCTGLPLKSSCAVNGATNGTVTLTAGGQAATLVIATTAPTTASLHPLPHPNAPLFAFWTMLPGVAGIVIAGKRGKRSRWVLLAVAAALVISMTACGGGGSGTTTAPPPTPVPGTPAGTYTVTITSTAGSGSSAMTRSTQVTLTVQ